jgi:UDP-N-acetylmuramate dehydrogenase
MRPFRDVRLNDHSTLRLGGPAEQFVVARAEQDIIDAVRYARAAGIPFMVIGHGSNILFADSGYAGLIIRNDIRGYEFYEKNGDVFVGVGAGETWDDFVANMVKRGLYGVENLSGIPGSVGATPVQNVGAYGVEVGDVIAWVDALNTETLQSELFTGAQCRFGYRDSFFKTNEGRKYVITEVGFRLKQRPDFNVSYKDLKRYFDETSVKPSLSSIRDAVLAIRSKKFPDLSAVGCAGSFFKNPIVSTAHLQDLKHRYPELPSYAVSDDAHKVPLAWILEHALGWKGIRRNAVGVHKDQPIVLVHYGGGSAQELKQLADDIAHTVAKTTRIVIEPEVRFVGDFTK